MSQEVGSYQTQYLLGLDLGLLELQEINVLFISHLVYGIFVIAAKIDLRQFFFNTFLQRDF